MSRTLPDAVTVTVEQIRAANADAVVFHVSPNVADGMEQPLLIAGERLETDGRPEEALVLLLLSVATTFWLNLDKPKAALVSRGHLGTMRFIGPEDLTAGHLDVLTSVLPELTNHELRARVADLLWQQRKKKRIDDVRSAIVDYLASAKALEHDEHWPNPFRRVRRAWQLARSIGASHATELAPVDEYAMDLFRRLGDTSPFYFLEALGDLLLETNRTPDEQNAIAEQLERAAEAAASAGDPLRARRYYHAAVKWRRRLGQEEALRRLGLAAGETYVTEAMTRDATVRAILLASAVLALRDAGAAPERLAEVRRVQAEAAKAGVSEMKMVTATIDVADIVKRTQERVRGKSLEEALRVLALGNGIAKVADLRTVVTERMDAAPLRHLFRSTTVDHQGRVVGARGAALSRDPAEAEEALIAEMTREAMLQQQLIARAFVRPVLEIIEREHHVGLREMLEFVIDRPFVPRGRELIFAKGLLYGFNDDFGSAVSLLIPQVENGLRNLLVHAGEHPYAQGTGGVQDFWDLNRVIDHPKLLDIVGEDQVFDLRGLLVARSERTCAITSRMVWSASTRLRATSRSICGGGRCLS